MTSINVGGLTFYNDGTADANGVVRTFTDTKGWFDGAPTKTAGVDRPWGSHGAFAIRAYRGARLITITTSTHAPTRRLASDEQRALAGLLAEGSFDDFTVSDADQGVLMSSVRLEGTPLIDWHHAQDIDCLLTFLAPDPLRYAAPVTQTTGFPVQSGGLEYDLYTDGSGTDTGFLEYGIAGATGRILLTNTGNSAAWPAYAIAGPVSAEGFEILAVGSGATIRFQGAIPAGSTLLLDSAQGAETALMDGVSDRSGQVTRMDPMSVPANGSLELAFVNLGTITAAQMTVTIRPGSW